MEVNTISNEVEEEDYETCLDGGVMESDDEEKNIVPETPCLKSFLMDEEEEGMEPTTPGTETDCNDASNTPREIGSTQYVQHTDKQYHWCSEEVVA